MLGLVFHSENIVIDASLLLCSLHNNSVLSYNRDNRVSSGALVCSNTFSIIMSSPKIVDIATILHTISKHRSEQCCLALISCLLVTCKSEQRGLNDDDSDSSSVEVLRALTTHLSSPINGPNVRTHSAPQKMHMNTLKVERVIPASESEINDPAIQFFDKMAREGESDVGILEDEQLGISEYSGIELLDQLINDEETNIADILLKCVKLCPSVFGINLSLKSYMFYLVFIHELCFFAFKEQI